MTRKKQKAKWKKIDIYHNHLKRQMADLIEKRIDLTRQKNAKQEKFLAAVRERNKSNEEMIKLIDEQLALLYQLHQNEEILDETVEEIKAIK